MYKRQVLDGMDVKGIIMGMMESAIGHQVRSAFMGQEHLDLSLIHICGGGER